MSVEQTQNNGFKETLQNRGWRQMSARLDREMPVYGDGFPRGFFLILIALLFLLGLVYWRYLGETSRQQPINPLPHIAGIVVEQNKQPKDQDGLVGYFGAGQQYSVPGRSERTADGENAPDLELLDGSGTSERNALTGFEGQGTFLPIDASRPDMVYGKGSSIESEQNENPGEHAVPALESMALAALKTDMSPGLSLERRRVPLHTENSFRLHLSNRLDKRFSHSGLDLGLAHHWTIGRWSFGFGGEYSIVNYFSPAHHEGPGAPTDRAITIKKFVFEEGIYSSYNDITILAGKTHYAGVNLSIDRGIFSALHLSAGSSLKRIVGGADHEVKLYTEGFGESNFEPEQVNAQTLVRQDVMSPWLWSASAGLKWYIRPDFALSVRYEQPLNHVFAENSIALDEYPSMRWFELGMNIRLLRY